MASEVFGIPIDRIHLYEENPRHGQMTDPPAIIEYLLEDEQVWALAQSIAEHETNPLELVGVVRLDDEDDSGEPTFEVWEGNRRVCAIMLLNDPDQAPAKYRKRFHELAEGVEPIQTIDGRIFDDKKELRFWMRNIHNGMQGGRGRKDWGPDEQHRDNPTRKNAIAFDYLDRAERLGLISKSQRVNKLTTLQRYVGSEPMRKLFRADDKDPSNVKVGRSDEVFDKLLAVVIADLLAGEISSRHNEDEIGAYSNALEVRAGVTSKDAANGKTRPVNPDKKDGGSEAGPPPPPTPRPSKVKKNDVLKSSIAATGSDKLRDLYHSLHTVSAKSHPQLIAVGAWSFIESIARFCGASEQPFTHWFKKGRISELGFPEGEAKTIVTALDSLSKGGNTTKHHAVSASFNHDQIINDMEVVSPMLAKALENSTS